MAALAKIDGLIRLLQSVNVNQDYFLIETLENNSVQADILDLNVEQHKEKGVDANGNPFPLPYAPMTIRNKRIKGQRYDIITLDDTGEWHSGFQLEVMNDAIRIYSTDWKNEILSYKWGDVYGLTYENRVLVSQTIRAFIVPIIEKYLKDGINNIRQQ